MTSTIRIERSSPRSLFFEIDAGTGGRITTSASFKSIYRMEAGHAVLFGAGQPPCTDTTSLGPSKRRKRVRFDGRYDADWAREVLSCALAAIVLDERPADHRRADLSGRLCDLEH